MLTPGVRVKTRGGSKRETGTGRGYNRARKGSDMTERANLTILTTMYGGGKGKNDDA